MKGRKARDVAVLIALAVVFAVSLAKLRRIVGFGSPWVGLIIMLDVLGLATFARPVFLLRMPGFLRNVRAWEGALYSAIGVPQFGVLLRRTPLRFLNTMVYLTRLHDPSSVMAQAECAEAAHFYAGSAFIPHMAYACTQGWWGTFVWMMAVQIGFNLYPMLHLRRTRERLEQLHVRLAKRGLTP